MRCSTTRPLEDGRRNENGWRRFQHFLVGLVKGLPHERDDWSSGDHEKNVIVRLKEKTMIDRFIVEGWVDSAVDRI